MEINQKNICFLLFPYVHVMDMAGAVQVFYEATQLGNIDYKLIFAAASNKVLTEQGLTLSDLQHPSDISLNPNDFIIIPGIDFQTFTTGSLQAEIKATKSWIHKNYETGVKLATVCTASMILAEIELLNSKSCTTHWKCIDYLQENYPEVKVESDKLFVSDAGIYTSAGMTSGIDMSLSIIEENQGPIVSSLVAREMVVYLRRQETSTQHSIYLDYHTHFNPLVHKVQNYIIANPDKNPSLKELARIGNTSVRNLTRSFKEATGHTVTEFKNNIKLELARHLINNPNYTVSTISQMCGFKAPRQLQRLWKNKYGTPISDEQP
ncbi:MAG: helix-turn-helix domain-containing protein [Balneolaceae bacterium]|nr:helix-turn-helix domain-containing protein [Balneolaceae bacterium]